MHARNFRMLLQIFRHRHRRLALPLHAQFQRFHSADQQERRFGIHRAAQINNHVADFLDQHAASGRHSRNHVGMSRQIFRRAVHHQVESQSNRFLQHGARKRVVDQRNQAPFLGEGNRLGSDPPAAASDSSAFRRTALSCADSPAARSLPDPFPRAAPRCPYAEIRRASAGNSRHTARAWQLLHRLLSAPRAARWKSRPFPKPSRWRLPLLPARQFSPPPRPASDCHTACICMRSFFLRPTASILPY